MKLTKDILKIKGPNKLKDEYKKTLKLSQQQRNIIVGTLLGDGYLDLHGTKPSYRYYFSQKELNKDYVYHIYSYFEDWCSQEPKNAKSGKNIQDKDTTFVYFRTCVHPSFIFYANQFYLDNPNTNKREKVVPKLLHKWLTAEALAYWFMDDGSKNSSGYLLNTQNFTLKEQERLADALGRKFNFEINLHKDRNNYRLYITAKSRDSFTNIISPFILPCFKYKLFSP